MQENLITQNQKTYFEIGLVILGVCIICGNGFVLTTMYRYPRVRTVSNTFICSLAISDLIVGVLTVPVTLASLHTDRWLFGDVMCSLSAFLDNMAIIASIWNLEMSSVDRYVAITRPLRYKSLVTYKLSYIMIGTVWAVCATLALLPLLGWDAYVYTWNSYNCGIEGNTNYFLFFLILGIFVPLLVITYNYLNIGYYALKHSLSNKGKNKQGIAVQRNAVKMRNFRISATILTIIGAFLVCTFPLFIMGLLQFCGVAFTIQPLTDMLVHVLLLSNSALNPILYSFGTYQFRAAFIDMLYCRTTKHIRHNSFFRQAQFRAKQVGTPIGETTTTNPLPTEGTGSSNRVRKIVKRASSDEITVCRVNKEATSTGTEPENNAQGLSDHTCSVIKSIKFRKTDEIARI